MDQGRLESEDLDAKLGGKTIQRSAHCGVRCTLGKRFRSEYFIQENAFYIMAPGLYVPITGIENIVKQYTAQGLSHRPPLSGTSTSIFF